MNISFCPYAVAACWTRDNAAYLTPEEQNVLLGWVRSRSYKLLAAVTSNPRFNKSTRERFSFFMQLEAFFKKNASFTDEDTALAAAVSSFERGERICQITNKRLDYYYAKRDRIDPDLANVIKKAEHFVQSCLGDFDAFLNRLPELVKVTSGATASLPRRKALPPLKIKRTVEAVPGSFVYLEALSKYYGQRFKVKPVTSNRVEFVPKSWKTHRGIACEPTGSLPLQLAFDTFCKERLKKRGVDLSTQVRNQDFAREGSINGRKATIDLSMASDTLAFNTVAWLLPRDWFEYLRNVRSPQYCLNGKLGFYAKFSSMGNGATFALESLIFLALARACGDANAIVYGDDIIIDVDCAPLLYKALKFFGFIPNVEKSFTSGPFRESCGGNYYEGIDITPFYIREDIGKDLCRLSHVLNGLQRIASPYGELIRYVVDCVANNDVLLVPVNDDSLSGFHVHPHVAYRLKLIRNRSKRYGPYVPVYRGYKYKLPSVTIRDTRAWWIKNLRPSRGSDEISLRLFRFLVHHCGDRVPRKGYEDRVKQLVNQTDCAALQSTEYGLSATKYRRQVRRWVLPTVFGAWDGIFSHSILLATKLGVEV